MNYKEINIQRDGLKKADKTLMINNTCKDGLETNESLILKAFSKISKLRSDINIELRWICLRFKNLWNCDNYLKNLIAEFDLTKGYGTRTYISIWDKKRKNNDYTIYIIIKEDMVYVSTYANTERTDNNIYFTTLLDLVSNPHQVMRKIKRVCSKEFKEINK